MREFFMTTERLAFSRWRRNDEALARLLWGNPQVTRLICATSVFTDEEILARLALEVANGEKFGVQYWPSFLRKTEEFIGCCGLRPRAEDGRVFELGFHLRPEYWRQGIAFEAASAVIGHAFLKLSAAALVAGHNPRNEASRSVLMRLGFVHTHDELYPPTDLMHPTYRLDAESWKRAHA